MFTPQELSWFKNMGATPAEVIRGLRQGSALDYTFYTTTCVGCHQQARQPLRWFHERKFRCSCGAQFDSTELGHYMMAMMRNDKDAARRVAAVEIVEEFPEGDA